MLTVWRLRYWIAAAILALIWASQFVDESSIFNLSIL